MSTPTHNDVCVIVPAFQEGGRIGPVVTRIKAFSDHVVVVDDGCTDATAAEARAAGAHVIEHGVNRGKGAALQTGFEHAAKTGFAAVITMDADGQHDPAHIPELIAFHLRTGIPVVVGSRMGDARTMPLVRRLTNLTMSGILSWQMRQRVADTQSGYRLYRTDLLPLVKAESGGYAAESEALLRLAAAGVRIGEVPIRVIYGDEESKIRPGRDTIRFFRMLLRFRRESKQQSAAGRNPSDGAVASRD